MVRDSNIDTSWIGRNWPGDWVSSMVKTNNQMGVMIRELPRPTESFIRFAEKAEKPVLDIGCAYGLASLHALARGATVYAVDADNSHLKILADGVPEQLQSNIIVRQARFPEELNFEPNSFSAIHMSMILHFLPSDTIIEGLKKCFSWLEPDGKIFIGNMTPYLGIYNWEKLSKEYEERAQRGEEWPGEIEQRPFAKGEWKKQLPEFAHFFKEDSMKKIAELSGFTGSKVYYYSFDSIPDEYKTNGKEYVALEATRP